MGEESRGWDAAVPRAPRMMAGSVRCVKESLPPKCNPPPPPRRRLRAEEYVAEEREPGRLLPPPPPLPDMPQEKRSNRQPCHVRRSAELRTVSIIETLSELVAQTDACHLGGPHGDCDAQCQKRCRARPSCCRCLAPGVQQRSAAETTMTRRCPRTACAGCSKKGGVGCLFRVGDSSSSMGEPSGAAASNADKSQPQADRTVCRGDRGSSPRAPAGLQRVPAKAESEDAAAAAAAAATTADCIHCLSRCCCAAEGYHRPTATTSAVAQCCPPRTGPSRSGAPSSSSSSSVPVTARPPVSVKTPVSPKSSHKRGRTLSHLKRRSALNSSSQNSHDPSCPIAERTPATRKSCPHALHDSSDFMLSTLRSKGRTPDWIAGIFSISRRGNLERLAQALLDMDATLIRNLSDHRGNNLFHVCCCYGHLECLQWLLQRGKQCEDAILDENKYELTPLVCAVKYGKLPCVEWLIRNTIAQGQLVPGNGSRPLLHWAAKYGQEVILRWLAEYMEISGMNVNVKDGYGNTALHLAAKHGHAVSIKALVTHRCDVSLKNDLGYKASDYAILYGQTACSEYLLSLEACLLLSSDVSSLDADLGSSKAEMSEMKIQFKDVLSCAKKLVKEREELSQHLDRLQDGLVHLNDIVIGEIQALCEENSSLRKQLISGSEKIENSRRSLDETIALCHAMHTRWQDGQQRWLSPTALADIQQKILLAEERWKRARARVTWGEKESKEHMNIFRERLTQVQCRATGIRLSEIRSISSSESSLASMEDTLSEYEERYEQVIPSKLPSGSSTEHRCNCEEVSSFEEQRPRPPTLASLGSTSQATGMRVSQVPKSGPSVRDFHRTNRNINSCNVGSSLFPKSVKKVSSVVQEYRLDKIPSLDFSGGLQKRDAALRSLGQNGQSRSMELVKQSTCKVLEVIVSSNNERTHASGKEKRGTVSGVDDFMHDLQQSWEADTSFKGNHGLQDIATNHSKMDVDGLTPTLHQKKVKPDPLSGNCKLDGNVLESRRDGDKDDDDNDGDDGEQQRGRGRDHQKGQRGGSDCSARKDAIEGSGSSSSEKRINFEEGRDERNGTQANADLDDNQLEFLELDIPALPLASALACHHQTSNGKLISPEPDLIIGTKGIRTDYEIPAFCSGDVEAVNVNCGREPMATNVNPRVSFENLAEEDCLQLNSEQDLVDVPLNDDEIKPLLHPSGGISFTADDICMGISLNVGSAGKRRGFLQKFNLHWPSKRKVKSTKRVQEITPEDFRETYMHSRNANGIDEAVMEIEEVPANEIVTDGCVGLINFDNFDVLETGESENCLKSSASVGLKEHISAERQSDNLAGVIAEESASLLVKQNIDAASLSSSGSSTRIESVIEQNVVSQIERPAPHIKTRNLPIPPIPVEPRIPPQPPILSSCSSLKCASDHHSIKQDSNFVDSANSCVPQKSLCSESRRQCRPSDATLESAKEQFVGERNSSRPEVDQNMSMLIGLELGMSDEQSTLIHSQADMPPLRPVSRGAKSDQSFISRPESSASRAESYSAYRLPGFPLRKVSSLSTDVLTPGSSTPNRMSPAPSEVSKTESALSPPSDISKTESMRNMRHLTRIEEKGTRVSQPVPALPMKQLVDIKTATIIDTNLEVQKQMQLQEQLGNEGHAVRNSRDCLQDRKSQMRSCDMEATCSEKKNVLVNSDAVIETSHASEVEKPWYELSDDEEPLMPETLRRTIGLTKNSSEDEDVYYCA